MTSGKRSPTAGPIAVKSMPNSRGVVINVQRSIASYSGEVLFSSPGVIREAQGNVTPVLIPCCPGSLRRYQAGVCGWTLSTAALARFQIRAQCVQRSAEFSQPLLSLARVDARLTQILYELLLLGDDPLTVGQMPPGGIQNALAHQP